MPVTGKGSAQGLGPTWFRDQTTRGGWSGINPLAPKLIYADTNPAWRAAWSDWFFVAAAVPGSVTLAATSVGTATSTASTVTRFRRVAATSTGTSATTAALLRSADAITAVSAGGSVTSANMARRRGLIATSTGTAATTADLTVTTGTPVTSESSGGLPARFSRITALPVPDTFPAEWDTDRDEDAVLVALLAELT